MADVDPLHKRARMEWNLNTLLNLITLLGMIGGGGWAWANTTRDIQELQTWRVQVESRLANSDGKLDERFKATDLDLRKIDNLSYRVAAAEQFSRTTENAIKDLQTTVSGQSGDLKVIMQLLERIEATQRGRPPPYK
ncbi:hypothetical protein [Agrobacterium vitis]|uniref:hypothetical protein n=1 Tax=Agrobacterium vitis TaxID=373 RepID=UPI0008720971|nr:hypothetical protein [Agrobacterium vitis]MCM2471124.1 hypothetical protein [Agrobacterium vitis]MUO70117.1 hypothetical protein [Agrobacterium vitis]MVA47303.1 hypothetical protein [Agrobacterium vitis]NTA34308.1 hypothetical protein [Agrobacterium vitis]BCH55977.1 hypothetical protein RvVAR031_35870 [Agrobacterium vitis]